MTERRTTEAPIGVFDSGVGGLTVLAELTRELPAEDFVYLETARLPYGTQSAESIRRYHAPRDGCTTAA
jgi:glutamate racemase